MTDSQPSHAKQLFDFSFKFFVFAILLGVIYTWISFVIPMWGQTPGQMRDDVFYDSLAFNLAQDRGFALDFSDLEWLEIYAETPEPQVHDWIYDTEVSGPTTSRGPGFPFLMSVVYRACGRDFDAVRIANMIALALGLTCLICCVRSYFGYVAAIFSLILISVDYAVMSSPGSLITESLGTGLVAVTFSSAIWAWNKGLDNNVAPWRWFFVGLFFALALLVRTTLVAWLLQIAVLLVAATLYMLVRRRNPSKLIVSGFLFLAAAIIVCLPWWNRNCQVTEQFSPFGCAGSIGYVGGFSDEALANDGNWSLEAVSRRQAQTFEEREMGHLNLPQQEYVMGVVSQQEAMDWAKNNAAELPRLSLMKALNHLALTGQSDSRIPILNGLVLFGALIGIYGTWRRFGFWLALVTFMSLATTIATWSHFGRFAIPIRPLWYVGCALGTLYVWWPGFRKRMNEVVPSGMPE